ncbi:CCR4-NOT transcription complex subunit 4 [Trichonephila inaurata madagascariensis]|uniref:CCR4-NOT transcription complex subunit 4 n=1 Tax=Trichonephila inaurata madagascariensis TaxID=2747483 RepID=A0A8X6XAK7_9ARAC|nr:CCR4-NOT transcription complex subunit 4 [Trichonephila inaurata madagascariensis]
MSLHDEQNLECPLCMEPFEMDDFNFFPCTCGYQICRFCWHRIRTDENGLCPACRKQYPEDPADFKPLTTEEWQKIKNEKKQKDQQKKQKLSECRKHLANVRVVQKNLVFVVGLPARLADPEVLKKFDYFGKFGKIHKVVVNQSTSYAGSQGPSASAYVTYCKPEDALRAIKSVNNIQVDGRTLKASLGTTKYCSHFLKNQQCPKTDCMYLHELGDEAASFTKEDMQQGKHQEYEKKLQDQIIGNNSRKQTASPPPPQINTSSLKDSWPCTVQNVKESRSNRTKDSTQKTEGKSSRSKNKSEGQKSKKSKSKTSDSTQHHSSSKHSSTKEDSTTSQKKSQKGKHKDTVAAQPSGHSPLPSPNRELSLGLTDVLEMNQKNAQTTYVHIEDQPNQSKAVSASIKIARSESPVLPPSPLSSLSSSFTPFGSLSSNFMSSSSPSPPPSNSNPASFGSLSGSSNGTDDISPVNTFVAPQQMEQKRQSPHPVFVSVENNSESLFSHMKYHTNSSSDGNSYNGHMYNEEPCTTDSSDWSSNYSFEEPQKPEDDLDFDPWNESSKGLADLIAKEAVHNPFYSEMPTPPGFFQPSKAPVPNQQRMSVPPPGFCRQVPQNNSLNNLPGMYDPSNLEYLQYKVPQARQTMNGCSHYFHHDQPQNPLEAPSQYKQQQFPQANSRENCIETLRLKKNWEERVRNLLPDMFFQINSRNLQKNQNQNAPTWNHQQGRDWLTNETMLNSGNVTDGQRSNNTLWLKALQQLSIEENQLHGHSPFANGFALRGQWATAQCPPPGFVAPSRSSVNTPFQHMPVNQKI